MKKCCKLCSHPRVYARKLANCLIISLHEEEMTAWRITGEVIKHEADGIAVSTKDGKVYDNGEVWMPFFQRWKLVRAARQRAIMIAQKDFGAA